MKLLMLKGLPGSGKSTYAKTLVYKGWIRVNNDELRLMLNNGKWSKQNESRVGAIRDFIIRLSLNTNYNVVVDNLNLHPKHTQNLQLLAKETGADFEEKFFDTTLEECIRRDLLRERSVGAEVIKKWHRDFVAPPQETYVAPPGKPEIVLCDIDGTLAHMVNRGPFEWHKVGSDSLDTTVNRLLVEIVSDGITEVIFMSGRDEVCRPETTAWLEANGWADRQLFMRTKDDNRSDAIIKRELFDEHIKDNYRVRFILDDRNRVVEMWRKMGLKVLQVADGDF